MASQTGELKNVAIFVDPVVLRLRLDLDRPECQNFSFVKIFRRHPSVLGG